MDSIRAQSIAITSEMQVIFDTNIKLTKEVSTLLARVADLEQENDMLKVRCGDVSEPDSPEEEEQKDENKEDGEEEEDEGEEARPAQYTLSKEDLNALNEIMNDPELAAFINGADEVDHEPATSQVDELVSPPPPPTTSPRAPSPKRPCSSRKDKIDESYNDDDDDEDDEDDEGERASKKAKSDDGEE